MLQALLGLGRHEENTFHGVCLAIGELCISGLLQPQFIQESVDILKQALLYEDVQGSFVGGTQVRDAACYLAWSFARIFDRTLLAGWVEELAEYMLLCALFDKSKTCRRAAAAAFQENVGRQGDFPFGIEIISEMDYFSVGLITNSYLKIAVFVSSFANYAEKFFNHLLTSKIYHIEKEIRELACKSLALIVVQNQ